MEKVKTAVVGAGIMGEIHARAYSEYDKSELVAVCDIEEKKAKKLARAHKCSYTTRIKDIAADPTIKAVSIATPDFAHRQAAVALAEAGKHLLVEKPLADDVEDAAAIVRAVKRSGVLLMVDFHNRWNPLFVDIKDSMDRGKIGRPRMGYVRLSNPLKVPLGMLSWAGQSGPEWFLLPHTVDLMCWLWGRRPRKVYARGEKKVLKSKGIDAYDTIQAMVSFDDGSFVTFETSWILPDSWPCFIDFKLAVVGERGRIGAECDRQGVDVASEKYSWPFVLGLGSAYGKSYGFFIEPMKYFIDVVRGERKPVCTANEGLDNVRIIEAIVKSIKSGKPVTI